jgi:hypothetical protein
VCVVITECNRRTIYIGLYIGLLRFASSVLLVGAYAAVSVLGVYAASSVLYAFAVSSVRCAYASVCAHATGGGVGGVGGVGGGGVGAGVGPT